MGRPEAAKFLYGLADIVSDVVCDVTLLLPFISDFQANLWEELTSTSVQGLKASELMKKLDEIQKKSKVKG